MHKPNPIISLYWQMKINTIYNDIDHIIRKRYNHKIYNEGCIVWKKWTQDLSQFIYIRPLNILFKDFNIFNSSRNLVKSSRRIWTILVEGQPRNIPVNYFWNWSMWKENVNRQKKSVNDIVHPQALHAHLLHNCYM